MIVILGGGVTGLAAALHLARERPELQRVVLEKEGEPGGLCRSTRASGFTFDLTGHYLHLREPETIALVEELLGDELVQIERRAAVAMAGKVVPFPFQAHLHGLPPERLARCLVDLFEVSRREPPETPSRMPFGQWSREVFGEGMAELFMLPYNRKLFCVEPDELTAEWVGWAVPRPSVEQVVRGALGLENPGLGYNSRFRYPRRGGIDAIVDALVGRVGEDLRLGAEVVSIDAKNKRVVLEGGEIIDYERLVSTLPLPFLLQRVRGLGSCSRFGRAPAEMAGELRWTRVAELRLGVRRAEIAEGAHWLYVPDPDLPFYRVGFPSNVLDAMAPAGCSSLSVEFGLPSRGPVPTIDELEAQARAGLERLGLLAPDDEVVFRDLALLDPAYVVFDEKRTPVVEEAIARLEEAGILSIGRFGAWTYSYVERSLIDGREAARRLIEEC